MQKHSEHKAARSGRDDEATVGLALRPRLSGFVDRRRRHPYRALALPAPCAVSGVATRSITSRAGHGAAAVGAFGSGQSPRGVTKLCAAAASQIFAGGRAACDATARIPVSGAGSTRGGGLGGCRASDPTAGITVSGLPAAARADSGRGRADDPSRSIADYSALRARRLLLALDGLNHPPRSVTNHLAAGLCA